MSAADIGVSVPTLLGRRVAALGVLAFPCLIGGSIACFAPTTLAAGGVVFALGCALGLWAIRLLYRAFTLRRQLIVERHILELTAMLGAPPPLDTVVAETGCRETEAKALLAQLSTRAPPALPSLSSPATPATAGASIPRVEVVTERIE